MSPLVPYVQDPDLTIYNDDALSVLRQLPDESVHMCATSPPFYGLRDYGTGHWKPPSDEWAEPYRSEAAAEAEGWLGHAMTRGEAEEVKAIYLPDQFCSWRGLATAFAERHGFDWASNQIAGMDLWLAAQAVLGERWQEEPDHEHDRVQARGGKGGSGTLDKRSAKAMPSTVPAAVCSCGAEYHDPQIGLEATPDEWVANLVSVFAEVRRVLRPNGTLWVEIGDSYNSGTSTSRAGSTLEGSHGYWENPHIKHRINVAGVKPKDLLGQPWLLAFALRADGWWLRQSIIWHKPNAMPESATDRCTTNHSYVFLLSKQPRYFFDAEAIAEPAAWDRWGDQTVPKHEGTDTASGWMQPKSKDELRQIKTKKPDGWDTGSGAHGTIHRDGREKGEANYVNPGNRSTNGQRERSGEMRGFDNRLERADGLKNARSVWTIPTKGYPDAHFATWPEALVDRIIKAGSAERDVVLDPFLGSGTTALVARKLNRRCIGVELSRDYCALAARRTSQLSLEAEVA